MYLLEVRSKSYEIVYNTSYYLDGFTGSWQQTVLPRTLIRGHVVPRVSLCLIAGQQPDFILAGGGLDHVYAHIVDKYPSGTYHCSGGVVDQQRSSG